MFRTFFYQLSYIFFWVAYFLLARILFVLYLLPAFLTIDLHTIAHTFIYGMRMDLSMAAYVSVLPFFAILVQQLAGTSTFSFVKIYTYFICILFSVIIVTDVELFSAWGFRMDISILPHLRHPAEAAASALSSPIILLMSIAGILVLLAIYTFQWFFSRFNTISAPRIIPAALSLLMTACLLIPMRGGLQLAPLNESSVCFSTNNLANQTALNCLWNLMHSMLEKSQNTNPYAYFTKDEAQKLIEKKQQLPQAAHTTKVVNLARPNVVLLIWESFTAKALENYEGKVITPEFNQLKKQGIYFESIYAAGDRSDKGIIGILSGYPAAPQQSIINNPYKCGKLPALMEDFSNNGYRTGFYYGGEPEFANIKSFLVGHRLDKLVSKDDFDKNLWNSKWGAHDEHVLNRLLSDLNKETLPFFMTCFTLSSHEPFEIPMAPLLAPVSKEKMFLNAIHYSDRCIGRFIASAKKTAWWRNTLIVIVADHGHPLPGGNFASKHPSEFKIPMLWLGGALSVSDTVINQTGSQTDIAATLLTQLNVDAKKYTYSQNLLAKGRNPFAFYCFNDGFGWMNDHGGVVFNNTSKMIQYQWGSVNEDLLREGKAYMQSSYADYLSR